MQEGGGGGADMQWGFDSMTQTFKTRNTSTKQTFKCICVTFNFVRFDRKE